MKTWACGMPFGTEIGSHVFRVIAPTGQDSKAQGAEPWVGVPTADAKPQRGATRWTFERVTPLQGFQDSDKSTTQGDALGFRV